MKRHFRRLSPIALAAAILAPSYARAQTLSREDAWHLLDPQTDSVLGISAERAYRELITKPGKQVLVGVIDAGFDLTHEDLRGRWWVNPGEVAGNGKDDDKDGYVDDVNGWSFIGGLLHGNLEVTRVVRALRPRYDNPDTAHFTAAQRDTLALYRRALDDFDRQRILANDAEKLEYLLNLEYDPYAGAGASTGPGRGTSTGTEAVLDSTTHFIAGNADVVGPNPGHGTHVSGIIAALRNNGIGMNGIADSVVIIPVRPFMNFTDELNTDDAKAIRYLVDHGAKVINMSYGKPYAGAGKVEVDAAIKYAMAKDVLIVHGAGNDSRNLDHGTWFPSPVYDDGGRAAAWIEVGASTQTDDGSVVASFSNYGKTTVDVFAPGVGIYSTIPGQRYVAFSGTSMAAPVVTGVAAVLRSQYPKLTAVQVKDIIMRSVTKITHPVFVNDDGAVRELPFSDVCVSGGVVNLYAALKLAATYTPAGAPGRAARATKH